MRILTWFFVLLLIITGCKKSGESSSALDDDTRAWWQTTTELSSDAMEGRDTGSPGYARAAALVAERFKAAGLPAFVGVLHQRAKQT
jgi:hypothetical protein